MEIPQQGQLRSLNVHVSGSIVIWEYIRQVGKVAPRCCLACARRGAPWVRAENGAKRGSMAGR